MEKATVIQNAVDTLTEIFKTSNFPERVATTIIRRQEGDSIPADNWSFANCLLVAAQGGYDARGYKQWQAVERHVKKGSKAIYILAPLTKKIKETDETTGEEKTKFFVTGFKPIPVFRLEDTEGEPLPKFDYTPKIYPPFFDVAEKLGITIEYQPMTDVRLGSYRASTNEITLFSQDAHVYYHELAHAVHSTFVDLKKLDTAKKEIVAEFSACVLCELSGISGYEWQGYEYIKHYCDGTAKPEIVLKKVMSVLNDVEKIISTVLDATKDNLSKQTKIPA